MSRASDSMEEVGAVEVVDPGRACIYGEGWQSWSITEITPLESDPYWPSSQDSLAMDCQDGRTPPPGVFQGSGLLAFDPGDGPVHVFGLQDAREQVPVVHAARRGSRIVVSADGPVLHGVDSGPGGIEGALARWGDGFTRAAGTGAPPVRQLPTVWCSWYQYFTAVTEADVLENLDAMDELDIPVEIVQIDDGYEAAPGDWLSPSGRFDDLPGLVGRIRSSGRRAGIWIAPFLVGRGSALYAAHPDWVVVDEDAGEPVFAGNAIGDRCAPLDVTHPAAAEHLGEVLATMTGWGVDYVKIDFAYAGALAGRRHESISRVAAYRRGVEIVRSAIGSRATLLGCGAPILPSVGLVDAMRIGPDIALTYEPAGGDPSLPSQRGAARNTVARAWQHGRFWVNDPDCLVARPEVERREDWADVVGRFGGLRASSDRLRGLDRWGLETTRRLLVPSPTAPFVPSAGAR